MYALERCVLFQVDTLSNRIYLKWKGTLNNQMGLQDICRLQQILVPPLCPRINAMYHKKHIILEIKHVIFHHHKCDLLAIIIAKSCHHLPVNIVCVCEYRSRTIKSQYYNMVARSANELWLEPGVQMNDILHHFWHSCFVGTFLFPFWDINSTMQNMCSSNDRMCLEQKASGHYMMWDLLTYQSYTSNPIRSIRSCDISFNRTRNVEEKQ